MKMRQAAYTVPRCIDEDIMPAKQKVLLMFLFGDSDYAGRCNPGYEAMKQAIIEKPGETGCNSTIRRYLKNLTALGWIFCTKKTQGRMTIFLRIPPRFVEAKEPAKLLEVVSQ